MVATAVTSTRAARGSSDRRSCASTPSATASRPSSAEATYQQNAGGRAAGGHRLQRREQLGPARSRGRGGAEPRSSRRRSASPRTRTRPRPAWDIALQNRRRAEVRAPRRHHQYEGGRDRAVREDGRHPGHHRRQQPAAPALQGLGRRVAAGAGRAAGRLPRGRAGQRGLRRRRSTTWARSPIPRPGRSRWWPGSRTPACSSPGSSPRSRWPRRPRRTRSWCPEKAVQASDRGFVAYVVEGNKARLRPLQLGIRVGDGGVEILSGVDAGR